MTTDESAGPAFATPELEDRHDPDALAERYQRARDAVIQSEARYRNLFETAIDAIYTVDPDGSFTSVNEATVRLVGLPKSELLGRSSRMLFDDDELALVKEEFRHSLAGSAVRFECRLRRADGGHRQISVTNTPIRAGRDVVGVLGVARDVTVERERAAALERSEARYTRLMESAADGIFTIDAAGRFAAVNQSLERGVGRSRDELLGAPFDGVVDARDLAVAQRLLRDTLAGQRCRSVLRYHAADGRVRHGSLITAPVMEDDVIVGAHLIMRDVTGDQCPVSELLGGVASELNELLASVLLNSERLLASAAADADTRATAEVIRHATERAAMIATRLLALAQRQPSVTG